MSTDVDQFLLGSGAKSAKFPTVGTVVKGKIVEQPVLRQQTDFTTGELLTWDDGSPRMQLVVKLATDERDPGETDDDGTRALYVKGEMRKAIADALKKAGKTGLAVGGTLAVKYTGDGPKPAKGFAPKLYAAQYEPPAAGEDFFAAPAASAAADEEPPF